MIVAFQTSVPYFSAKPTIHCTKEHNSAISHEGQMWRKREKKRQKVIYFTLLIVCICFLNFILKVYIFHILTFFKWCVCLGQNCSENANISLFMVFQPVHSNQNRAFCRHLITAGCNNYLIHPRIWRGNGASGCELGWSWAFGPFFEHQSMNDTWGTVSALHITHWLPCSPRTLRHRTFPRTIKVIQVQRDGIKGCNRECKWGQKSKKSVLPGISKYSTHTEVRGRTVCFFASFYLFIFFQLRYIVQMTLIQTHSHLTSKTTPCTIKFKFKAKSQYLAATSYYIICITHILEYEEYEHWWCERINNHNFTVGVVARIIVSFKRRWGYVFDQTHACDCVHLYWK